MSKHAQHDLPGDDRGDDTLAAAIARVRRVRAVVVAWLVVLYLFWVLLAVSAAVPRFV